MWDYQSDLLIIAYKAQTFEKMVLKILLATLSLSSLVSCLPQRGSGDTPLCSEYPGYREKLLKFEVNFFFLTHEKKMQIKFYDVCRYAGYAARTILFTYDTIENAL